MTAPADPALFRGRLLDALLPALYRDARIRACWEGGSAATGRADRYSDIDLCLVGDAADHRGILDDLQSSLHTAAPIAHTWPIDPAPFPGMTQRIFLLVEAPPYFAVDCAVLTPAGAEPFLEQERHGEPIVYFDRDGAIAPRPLDAARHEARLRHRLAQIRASWPVYRSLVEKELVRGRSLDAIGFYFGGILRPLVELAGMRYRPERFDYGWRYLHNDLPAQLQERLTAFACIAAPATIAEHLPEIDALARRLMDELATPSPDAQASAARS